MHRAVILCRPGLLKPLLLDLLQREWVDNSGKVEAFLNGRSAPAMSFQKPSEDRDFIEEVLAVCRAYGVLGTVSVINVS